MKITDFIRDFNLHDSLLENCIYNFDSKELCFEIDFCYWAQKNYKNGDTDNGIVNIRFFDVYEFVRDDYVIHSDSIISIKQSKAGKIELTVVTDECSTHVFSFTASSVEFCSS